MQRQSPYNKKLVLVGGGHSHALVIRMLAMNPPEETEVTLISDVSHAPYSGMLPGLVSGAYSYDEIHIDLRKLCMYAGIRFIHASVDRINPDKKIVLFENRPDIHYDILSINIGSTPQTSQIIGAKEYAIASKPVPIFLERWDQVVHKFVAQPKDLNIHIIGGGVGGVEIALSVSGRFSKLIKALDPSEKKPKISIHLIEAGAKILPSNNASFRKKILKEFKEKHINVTLNCRIKEVQELHLVLDNNQILSSDATFWVTTPAPSQWIKKAGLQTDSKGFLSVHPTLQSVSCPHIFAAGDIASIAQHPLPKAGVFAVRQGGILYKNLTAKLQNKKLKPYKPQRNYLTIVGLPFGSALATKGHWSLRTHFVWKLKQYIDFKFMNKFINFPQMKPQPKFTHLEENSPHLSVLQLKSLMRCSGCAAKVGGSILEKALHRLNFTSTTDEHSKTYFPEDAVTINIPQGQSLLQSIDFMPTLVSDPFIFGQICVNHCFSDVFAMGAQPASALALALVPFGSDEIMEDNIFQLLSGVKSALTDMGALLLGGHTAENEKLSLGLVCNGYYSAPAWRKNNLQIDDHLILTKPLGTGTLFAAEMKLKSKGRWIEFAIKSMLQSNFAATQVLKNFDVHACTDVTGFGLAGHLNEMIDAKHVHVKLNLECLPDLKGSVETLQQGLTSSLHESNAQVTDQIKNPFEFLNHPKYPLLFDPQTSGGLLVSIPKAQVKDCIDQLVQAGYDHATDIGTVIPTSSSIQPIHLT